MATFGRAHWRREICLLLKNHRMMHVCENKMASDRLVMSFFGHVAFVVSTRSPSRHTLLLDMWDGVE